MAQSQLATKVATTPPTGSVAWDVRAAALELILTAIAGVTLGASDAADDPGSDAAKAIAVQGVTNGKPVSVIVKNGSSFSILPFNYMAFTYVGSTNNIATQVFKSGGAGGTTVATLTYTYVASGAADDDDIATITQS